MKKVLIINDNGNITEIQRFLSEKGYSFTCCHSFIESENYCCKSKVDLIISEMKIGNNAAIDHFNQNYQLYAKKEPLPIIFYDGHHFTQQMQENIVNSLEY